MHADDGLPASMLEEWTRDLFEAPHPTFRPDRDVTVVEDTATGRIVSALFLIPQVWSYAGVPMKVGQPELIATHPDLPPSGTGPSAVRRDPRLEQGGRAALAVHQRDPVVLPPVRLQLRARSALPPPCSGSARRHLRRRPAFTVRPATTADIGILAAIEAEATSGTALGPLRGSEGFALELARRPRKPRRRPDPGDRTGDRGAAPVGYVAHQHRLSTGWFPCTPSSCGGA